MTTDAFTSPLSRTFVSQRLRMHYLDWGNPDAPDLILVHGGQDHAHNWDWVARELRKDWHILTPDLRGHGDSAWPSDGNYAISAYVYDLAQLVLQRGKRPVSVVGHSLGGVISTRYAALYPDAVRRLVTIEGITSTPQIPIHGDDPPVADRVRAWIDTQREFATRLPRRYATLEEAHARMRENNAHLSDAQTRHLTAHAVMQNEDGTYSWKFDDYARRGNGLDISRAEERALIGMIECPVLLLHGQESWMANPDEDGRAALFRDARVVSFEGAGHWIHHDQTERFLDVLRGFL
jgi:pimeloyl-ACP methyl ester carboxylesterase